MKAKEFMGLEIYQSYVGEAQLKHISPKAIPCNASPQLSKESGEYELFKEIFKARGTDPRPWGMVSWAFEHKAVVTLDEFLLFAEEKLTEGYDCVFVNPMIGHEAIYKNVWDQGAHIKSGFDAIKSILTKRFPKSLSTTSGTQEFALCNYLIASPKYWKSYFKFVDSVIFVLNKEAREGTNAGLSWSGAVPDSGNPLMTMRAYVIERLFSAHLMVTTGMKACAFPYTRHNYIDKFGDKLGPILADLNSLKNRALSDNNVKELARWDRIRSKILESDVQSEVVSLDDPRSIYDVVEELIPESSGGDAEIDRLNSQIETIKGSQYFDRDWYLLNYGKEGTGDFSDPAVHYLTDGYLKGYNPGPEFSTRFYLAHYRDVLVAGINPLIHFHNAGMKEGRQIRSTSRSIESGLRRLTLPENGKPDSILKYDAEIAFLTHQPKIFVHVHLYHEDMSRQIIRFLKNLDIGFTLGVSVKSEFLVEKYSVLFKQALPNAVEVVVKSVSNKGRDVAPWVVYFREEIYASDLFLHVHTKHSTHNKNHAGWFRFAMHNMLGSKSLVNQIINIFNQDSTVGVVAPCYFWSLANQPNYGDNRDICESLFKKITDEKLPEECPDYPAGSFFWAKSSVLHRLLDLRLTLEDFDEERGQIDGTLAHGIERIIGILPLLDNLKTHKVTADIAYDLVRYIFPGRSLHHISFSPSNSSIVLNEIPKRKIAIFSYIGDNNDEVAPFFKSTANVDVYLFSDTPNCKPPPDVSLQIPNYIGHLPEMTARYVKTHPHEWFEEYDYVCWMDSNIYFSGDIRKYVDEIELVGADLGVIYHPARSSIIEEAIELAQMSEIDLDMLDAQVQKYENIRNVSDARLIESNFLIYNPNNPRIVQMMETWWLEINNFTHSDQMSVNFAVADAGVKVMNLIPNGESARCHDDFIMFDYSVRGRSEIIRGLHDPLAVS